MWKSASLSCLTCSGSSFICQILTAQLHSEHVLLSNLLIDGLCFLVKQNDHVWSLCRYTRPYRLRAQLDEQSICGSAGGYSKLLLIASWLYGHISPISPWRAKRNFTVEPNAHNCRNRQSNISSHLKVADQLRGSQESHQRRLQKKSLHSRRSRTKRKTLLLTGRQVVWVIYEYFKFSDTDESVLELNEIYVEMKNDNVQSFNTQCRDEGTTRRGNSG